MRIGYYDKRYKVYKYQKNAKKNIVETTPTPEQMKLVKEFEFVRNLAELKALSKYSLENPLTDAQFNRMMELKTAVFSKD